MDDMTPKQFFDQFIPLISQDINLGTWCPRHWGPCAIMHAEGMGATLEMLDTFIEKFESDEELFKQSEQHPICCLLGDDIMFDIWGKYPPPANILDNLIALQNAKSTGTTYEQ